VKEFEERVLEQYYKDTGYTAKCYVAEISDGITIEKI